MTELRGLPVAFRTLAYCRPKLKRDGHMALQVARKIADQNLALSIFGAHVSAQFFQRHREKNRPVLQSERSQVGGYESCYKRFVR